MFTKLLSEKIGKGIANPDADKDRQSKQASFIIHKTIGLITNKQQRAVRNGKDIQGIDDMAMLLQPVKACAKHVVQIIAIDMRDGLIQRMFVG